MRPHGRWNPEELAILKDALDLDDQERVHWRFSNAVEMGQRLNRSAASIQSKAGALHKERWKGRR